MMKLTWILPVCLALTGCMSASQHAQQLASTNDRTLTLGVVQKQIKVGMTAAEVALALGSPNMVTGDNQNHETWIYDKVATEASFSQDTGGVIANATGLGFVDGGNVTGTAGGNYNRSAGAASITQRTLTVVIKYSANNTVESVSYNSTRF